MPVDREAHRAALDEMVTDDHRLVVAGHSMGGLLARQWAARRVEQVDGVVTWCTPLLHDPDEAPRALHDKAPGLGWIGVPGRLSRTLCTQLCTRPWLAQWLYVLLYPRLPVGLARQFTQRIQRAWSSYAPHDGDVVLAEPAWRSALRALEQARVPVLHAVGERDGLAPPASAVRLGEDPAR